MKNIFLKGMTFGIGFTVALGICFISYAAWTNIITKSDGDLINATAWNELVNNINTIGAKVDSVSNIPTGFIGAFNLSSCPSGWIAADGNNGTPDLRGEFIRGLDSGRGVDSGRTLASAQSGSLIITETATNTSIGMITRQETSKYTDAGPASAVAVSWTSGTSGSYASPYVRTARPRNVALLYCMKQ